MISCQQPESFKNLNAHEGLSVMILDKILEYKIQQRHPDAFDGEDGQTQCQQATLKKISMAQDS